MYGGRHSNMAGRASAQPTPASWKTPYELYDERRTASSAASPASTTTTTTTTSITTTTKTSHTTSANPTQSGALSSGTAADAVNVRGISIAGWRIETHRGSIADSKTIDELSESWGIPMPEMPFDKNRLVIRYEGRKAAQSAASSSSSVPASSSSAEVDTPWNYNFDGMRALRAVEGVHVRAALHGLDLNSGGGIAERGGATKSKVTVGLGQKPAKRKRVQVAYANEWGKKRDQQQASGLTPPTLSGDTKSTSHFGADVAMAAANGTIATARDYDWTYSCTWPGCESSTDAVTLQHASASAQHNTAPSTASRFVPAQDPTHDRIPLERLAPPPTPGAKAEPILFFDDLILFEDELGDNGTSLLNVKVRVMPTGLLVLQRFFLRVDDVVFRVFDTRMYVSFYADGDASVDDTASRDQGSNSAAALPAKTAPSLSRPSPSTASATADLSKLSLGPSRRQLAGGTGAPMTMSPSSSDVMLAYPFRVIRECSGYQERYADVRARLPAYKASDLSPLTDPGWVAQQLSKMAEERQRKQQASSASLHPGTMVSVQQADPTQPAVLPSTSVPGQESNRILGEIADHDGDAAMNAEELWEGEGHRIDVAQLF